MPKSILDSGRPLALHVFYLAMETRAIDKAMTTALVLVALIMIINGITVFLAERFRRMLGGM